jgi:hypothetical protein
VCTDLRGKNSFFFASYSVNRVVLCNRGGECLLRGTDCPYIKQIRYILKRGLAEVNGIRCLDSVHGVQNKQERMCTNCGTRHRDSAAQVRTGQRVCDATLRRVRVTIVAVEKQNVLHILSVCVCVCVCVVLVTQHVQRMRSIILSSVACLAAQCFSILSYKRHDFRKSH